MKKPIIKLSLVILALSLLRVSGYSSDQLKQYILKYKNVKTFQATFIQKKHLSVLENDQKSFGLIKFKKENKMLWALEKPYVYQFILNGKKVIKKYPQLGEREEFNLDDNLQMKTLFDNIFLLMGHKSIKEIKKKYTVSSKNKKVILIPINKGVRKHIIKIIISFNNRNLIESIQLIEPSGDYTSIRFSNIKINQNVSDSEFSTD